MLRSLFSGSSTDAAAAAADPQTSKRPAATLLAIQADDYDWPEIFRGAQLRDGRQIRVVQCGWDDLHVHVDTYSSAGLCVDVLRLAKSASSPVPGEREVRFPMTVRPDFVLVRNEVKTPHFDGKGRLNGLLFADVPAVNSLESILLFCERPAVMGQLHRLHRRMGDAGFPVVPQHFASSHRCFMYGFTFPAVVKVGSAHAGVGKMKIADHRQMSDFRSVLAMMPDEHCFAEPFLVGQADLRIQKIGSHLRAFRRVGISGEWKTNTGSAMMEEVEMEDRWKVWVDAAAEMFGGLDIMAVDALVEETTGKEWILEVNGTSVGLLPECATEDNLHIRELVMKRMNDALCAEPQQSSTSGS